MSERVVKLEAALRELLVTLRDDYGSFASPVPSTRLKNAYHEAHIVLCGYVGPGLDPRNPQERPRRALKEIVEALKRFQLDTRSDEDGYREGRCHRAWDELREAYEHAVADLEGAP
jgi:hypothetical protein